MLVKGVNSLFLSEEEKQRIIGLLKQAMDPVLIYVFGSFAKGEGREDSDIDLAVLFKSEKTSYELFMICGELAAALGREVQLVDLHGISTVLGAQIVGNHQVLYCEDDVLRANMNIRFFKEYALLNEERACILEQVREDGRFYGTGRIPE